jgi:hypothetical protein
VVIGWIAAVACGLAALHRYEFTPGDAGASVENWPSQSRIPFDATRPNLVMMAHPRCPCTLASIEELAALMGRFGDAVACHVMFYRPAGSADAEWTETKSRRLAAAIPGVRVLDDVDSAEGARFGVETSGHLLVYNPAGRLIYSGGITSGRGRYGNSVGREAVAAILTGTLSSPVGTGSPTYGCPLFDSKNVKCGRKSFDATQR